MSMFNVEYKKQLFVPNNRRLLRFSQNVEMHRLKTAMNYTREGQTGLIGTGINIRVYFLLCVWSVELVQWIQYNANCSSAATNKVFLDVMQTNQDDES